MKILVIDGQGGKMGAALTDQIKKNMPDAEVVAVGTNSLATSAMLRAGADAAATGENPVVEFLFGLLVNRVLHLHVWDYSALPLNIMGQICLPFSLIWFVLTIPASALCKLCCRLSAFPKETKSASVITDP